MFSPEIVGGIFAILAALMWSLRDASLKKSSETIDFLWGTLMYTAIGYLVILAYFSIVSPSRIGFQFNLDIFIIGLFNILGYLFAFGSVARAGVAVMGALAGSMRPITSALLAVPLIQEGLTLNLAVGILAISGGVYLVSTRTGGFRVRFGRGEIFAILASTSWGVSAVYSRKTLLEGIPLYTAFISAFLVGLILLFSALLLFQKSSRKAVAMVRRSSLVFLTSAGVANISGGFLFFASLELVKVAVASPLSNLFPLFSGIIGLKLFGEKITRRLIIGAVLIFLGAYRITVS